MEVQVISGFVPLHVRPNSACLENNGMQLGAGSNQSRELVRSALSMVGIPYEWGGKGYALPIPLVYRMRASVGEHDGNQGFGLDCSGLVYQAAWRAYWTSQRLAARGLLPSNERYYEWVQAADPNYFGVSAIISTLSYLRTAAGCRRFVRGDR